MYSPLKPVSITGILGRWSMKFDFKACKNTTQHCLKFSHLLVTQCSHKLTENLRSKSLKFNIFYNALISENFFSNMMVNIIKTCMRPDRHQTAENGLAVLCSSRYTLLYPQIWKCNFTFWQKTNENQEISQMQTDEPTFECPNLFSSLCKWKNKFLQLIFWYCTKPYIPRGAWSYLNFTELMMTSFVWCYLS